MELQRERNQIFAVGDDGTLLCQVTFPEEDGVAVIDHTFVHESLRGQGVAGLLMREAVEAIRAQGWKLRATCPYAVGWLEKHPQEDLT